MAEPSTQITVAGDLSKPLCKLIDAVRAAVGNLWEPTQIRRVARAQANAEAILAVGQAEARSIEARARIRLEQREVRRQRNIEAIVEQAARGLPNKVSDTPIDEDWMHQFFEHCQDVSKETMQRVWASLLAGEVARPGSFSLRTLGTVKTMTWQDAQVFTAFCTCVWLDENGDPRALVFERTSGALGATGREVSSLLHLDSLGLVRYDPIAGLSLRSEETPAAFRFTYRTIRHILRGPDRLPLGSVILTPVGEELHRVTDAKADEGYRQSVLGHWRSKGFQIEEQRQTEAGSDASVKGA
jgi:uncharacterized repeat protein (TIGR03899 family)